MEDHCASQNDAATAQQQLRLGPIIDGSTADLRPAAAPSPLDWDDDSPVDWSEQEVVTLHCWLLRKVAALSKDTTALEEKIEILRWVFTDSANDDMPFSFVSCVEVASLSKCSMFEFMGKVDPQEIREWIALHVDTWLRGALSIYPGWVRDVIVANPDWVALKLELDPQWLNKQMRKREGQGDLFA